MTRTVDDSNWEIRGGTVIWSKALNEPVITGKDKTITEWVYNWASYFHPMNELMRVSSEIERYVAGRFVIPKELRKQFAEAVERVRAVSGDDDDEPLSGPDQE